jgi:prepilin-type N-terminal cleavage/methylation domain-containing protein
MLGPLTHRAPHRRVGFTLVELMVVLAIVAVLAAIALPSMREFVARKRLEGVAQELVTDLRLLKSHQIENRPGSGTSISFSSNDSRVCYALYSRGTGAGGTNEHCNCALAADQACGKAGSGAPGLFRQVDIATSTGITIAAEPTRLTVNGFNGMPMFNRTLSVTLSSPGAGQIIVSTNPAGLPTVCSVSGVFGAIRSCERAP